VPPASDDHQRTVAGRYRLIAPLGAGAMGTVWRAEDLSLGRDVAVKEVTFPPGVGEHDKEVLRERTRREARAAAGIDHPNAVTVFDVAEEDGTTYVVMELVPSRTLSEVMRDEGPLSPKRAAEVGLGVLGALEAAHAAGIVHRDVKPSNVLVRDDGGVVLTDFGISTATDDPSLTTTGTLVGSPAYMSPERARGEVPGPPADLWSLGATLYAAVEGTVPFDREGSLPTLSAVLTEPHQPPVVAGPELGAVLDGLLDKDPDTRLTAAAARQQLSAVAAAKEQVPAPTTTLMQPVTVDPTVAVPLGDVHQELRQPALPTSGRRIRPALVVAGLLVLAALTAGAVALTGDEPRRPTTALPKSATASPSPSAEASGSGTATVAQPASWGTYTSPDGWQVARPPGWAISTFKGQTQLKDPATGRTLRVSSTSKPKPDPVEDWQRQARSFAKSHDDYQEIGIRAVEYRSWETADWEFTYREGGTALHALNRGFIVRDDLAYSLFSQTRSGDWDQARATFDRLAESFQPGPE
jgi:serine/threonine protein kinase